MRSIFLTAILCSMMLGAACGADNAPTRTVIAFEAYVQAWHLKDSHSEQVAGEAGFPFHLTQAIHDRGELRVSGAGASYVTYSTPSGPSATEIAHRVSGMANFHVEADWALLPALLLGANVGLPTGRTRLTDDERQALVLFTRPETASRMPRLGSGLDVGVQAASSVRAGTLLFGGSAGYQYRGSYTAQAQAAEVNPGDELLLSGGVDYRGSGTHGNAALVFTHFGVDRIAGGEELQAGNELEFKGALTTRIAHHVCFAALRHIRRAPAEFGPDLDTELPATTGLYTAVRAGMDFRVIKALHLAPAFQARWLGRNGYGRGAATLQGPALDIVVSFSSLEVRLQGDYYSGKMNDGDTDVRGGGGGLTLALFL